MTAPTYSWRVVDHRLNRTVEAGEARSFDQAKSAALYAIRRAGGWRAGYAANINRPSGGGWFASWPKGQTTPSWEAWEPEAI